MITKEKKVTITRKIQLYLNYTEKEEFKKAYETLYTWQKVAWKSANLIATHHFLQENIKELFYLTDETKVKLGNYEKDESGILTTSKTNTTYQVLSKEFKGVVPTAILTAINNVVVSSFNKERKDYFTGVKSLRNYKRTMPIAFPSASIRNIEYKKEYKNYEFDLFTLKFRTNFGKDKSGNREIFQRSLDGDYKLCDSSIQIDGKNIYLLAVFQFDKQIVNVKKDIECKVNFDINYPMIVNIKDKEIKIGDKEEFLYRRLAIQKGLRRTMIAARYNKGGKGIKKKISSTEKFQEAEKNYVNYRMHCYSKKLIDLCLKYKCGKIILENVEEVKEETKLDEFLLRNWSYYGLREKIQYKAGKFGIEVEEA